MVSGHPVFSLLLLYLLVFVSGAVRILIVIPDNLPLQISRLHSFFGAEQEICIEIRERGNERRDTVRLNLR